MKLHSTSVIVIRTTTIIIPYGGYPRGVFQSLQTTFFLWFLDSKACRLPKNWAWSLHTKMHFFIPKACRLNFWNAKACRPNIFQGKASLFNKFLKVPVKYIILFTSHAFPQQTHYPSFIDLCLKVEQSLQLYGENWKPADYFFQGAEACRLLFLGGQKTTKI